MRTGNPNVRERGQATVEFALCLVAFIVILIGGIHFGEIGMLNVKVTEAANAAFYDATGRPAHHYDQGNGRLRERHATVLDETQARVGDQYRDFDGRDSAVGASPTLVFTRAGELDVTCERVPLNDLPVLRFSGSYVNGEGETVNASYDGARVWPDQVQRGVRCGASSSINLIPGTPSPRVFTEEGWLRGPILERAQIPVCGMGRAWNGACNPGTPFLVGEWALSNPQYEENSECDALDEEDCANPGYYHAVRTIYEQVGARGTAGTEFAEGIVGGSPLAGSGGEQQFYMSFKGSPSFQQTLNGTMEGRNNFTTTPGGDPHGSSITVYKEAYDLRESHGGCWLGMRCDEY